MHLIWMKNSQAIRCALFHAGYKGMLNEIHPYIRIHLHPTRSQYWYLDNDQWKIYLGFDHIELKIKDIPKITLYQSLGLNHIQIFELLTQERKDYLFNKKQQRKSRLPT